eukprot:1915615-Prymnesium_polylepis.1
MVRRKAVLGRQAVLRCLWHEVAYGLWCAVRRYSSATRLCGASGLWPMVRRNGVTGSRVGSRVTHVVRRHA